MHIIIKKKFKKCTGGLGLALESLVIVHNSDSELGVVLSSATCFCFEMQFNGLFAEQFAVLNYAVI